MRLSAAMATAAFAVAGCSTDRVADGRPVATTATYDCGQGRIVAARFDNRADTVTLAMAGRSSILRQRPAGSGIWYSGDDAELRGKGDAATITLAGQPAMECVAH